MFQHVNNVSQQMYFDLGKADFYRQVLQDDVLSGTSRIITAATANSFKEQIRMEDDIYVTTTVAKVGNKSITLFQQIIGRNAAGRNGKDRKHLGHGRFRLRPSGVGDGA